MLFNVVLLHVFTFFVHVVMSYYMWVFVRVVQCCLITCVHVFCSCCDVLGFVLFNVVLLHVFTFFVHVFGVHVVMSCGFMLFNVVLLHVFTFFVHVVMSRGSCCSMLSYYMCLRFLFML